ncbi:bifunctional 2',3'-cyclic-nucleotide 2'-phosphodiesterase/3'-nucleotidase [Roseovarius nanhaiticus]|uniref:bifunctional 2',3'-cyclic-nucleotide 2'-phosphodiesterase/3'-nucleotidase n=1 Tax=Roseovarius nanhaiticus TaxID=573024 RepID=UPI002492A099|nr:bifunctional 2',3'-cyclic-nucleotide 2'-phosphodiesterase/3'-nucleotidase [Roseovarius nanhaiticus]
MNVISAAPDRVDAATPLPDGTTAQLRLLGTTDLHAHVMAYDYYADQGGQPYGLVRIATAIRAARSEVQNTLLFDNGDALQGTPMGDLTLCPKTRWAGPSPVIDAMNALGYDAAGLGNHEFNFGIDWLVRTIGAAAHPVTCANVEIPSGAARRDWPVKPYLILDRLLTCEDGTQHPVRVGVLGLVPPQITMWDRLHLDGRLAVHDMVETARRTIPRLRAAGADLVVVLAHSGIGAETHEAMAENAALALAGLDGVDAIMTGHSHGLFPIGGATEGSGGVDHGRGLLAGVPAVMAGACGGHLGVLDLALEAREGRWAIAGHGAALRSAASLPCDPPLEARLAAAHQMTLQHMRQPIGTAAMRLHSYLALARPDASVSALNAVQTRLMTRRLRGTAYEGRAVLSATPAFKTGGRGGPRNFTDLPEGTLSVRHAADLYPFPNRLCGIAISGADLRDWLERAAICFARLHPGVLDQVLRNMNVPGHDFDVISGVTYSLDLTAQPLYDRMGQRQPGTLGRVRDLRHRGRPVADEAQFILATNTYRAFGAGAFAPIPPERIVHISDSLLRQDLTDEVGQTPLAPAPDYESNWRFSAIPGASALLDTGPGLRSDPAAMAALVAEGAVDLGDVEGGFCRIRLPF